jgi:YggT family protein
MIIAGYFLKTIAELLHIILTFFTYLIIARAILSWVNPDPNNGIVRFITNATDPLIRLVKGRIPPLGMVDLSPLVVLLVLFVLDSFLVGVLWTYSQQMLAAV